MRPFKVRAVAAWALAEDIVKNSSRETQEGFGELWVTRTLQMQWKLGSGYHSRSHSVSIPFALMV